MTLGEKKALIKVYQGQLKAVACEAEAKIRGGSSPSYPDLYYRDMWCSGGDGAVAAAFRAYKAAHGKAVDALAALRLSEKKHDAAIEKPLKVLRNNVNSEMVSIEVRMLTHGTDGPTWKCPTITQLLK